MEDQSLKTRLQRGPVFLFLGQRWLAKTGEIDPFLSQVLQKFGGAAPAKGYSAILNGTITDTSTALEWMAGRCPNIPVSEEMETVARFPWNGVFTSAIDDVAANVFRNPRRDVQRILALDYHPSDSRSRSKINLWYLFGNVTAPDESGYPPLNSLALIKRKGIATQMAAQVKELLTVLGTVCFHGYDPDTDWFDGDLFYMLVSSLDTGQAHWFGTRKLRRDHPLIEPLVASGQLVLHAETLAEELLALDVGDKLPLEDETETDAWSRKLRLAKRIVTIPDEIFRQATATTRLITEEAFAPLNKLNAEENYACFRAFLYESSHHPSWEGYARRYAFRRDFQSNLERIVQAQLSNPAQRSRGEPIIAHGATGSGKTVALGQLAFDIQHEGQYPVLFIDRGTRFRSEALDRFCQWAEKAGAESCLLVWDGMMSTRDYLDLHAFFKSRGRKVVLVGSAYQTDANFEKPSNSVRVESTMTGEERERFSIFLESVGLQGRDALLRQIKLDEESFLGRLYRELPATRSALQAGLGREVEHAEKLIRAQNLKTQGEEPLDFGTNLGAIFAELGIDLPGSAFGEKQEVLNGERVNEVQQLIGLVMVPGQFGIACPFELLMRAVGRNAGKTLIDTLRNIDIFHLDEDILGNPIVDARTALEAQLIARRTLGGAKTEVEYAKRLLLNVRSSFVNGTREIDFAVDLLRSIGPNGPREGYFRPYFADIAACLRALCTEKGIRHPRILLQESTYLREAAKIDEEQQSGASQSHVKKRERLDKALEACEEALKQVARGDVNRPMKGRLLVEMASTLGTLAQMETRASEQLSLVQKAHEYAWKAFSADSRNHYALDVIAWSARDMLNRGGITGEQKLQLVESVTTAFAVADAQEWDIAAANQLDRRRVELSDLIFHPDVSERAFDDLLARKSAAGVVVRAYQIAERESASASSDELQEKACRALDWMNQERHLKVVESSAHASFLRFKLWWRSRLGFDLNEGERLALPFSQEDWNQCLRLLARLLAFEEFKGHPSLRLIEAVGLFQTGDSNRGLEAFASLSSDQIFVRNRIVRRFVWSDQHGKPRRFSGRVVRLEERDGSLLVQGLNRWVPFFRQEVNRPELRRGDDLEGFGIAFNMLGPIAEFRR